MTTSQRGNGYNVSVEAIRSPNLGPVDKVD